MNVGKCMGHSANSYLTSAIVQSFSELQPCNAILLLISPELVCCRRNISTIIANYQWQAEKVVMDVCHS
jgi:hypothetical protein